MPFRKLKYNEIVLRYGVLHYTDTTELQKGSVKLPAYWVRENIIKQLTPYGVIYCNKRHSFDFDWIFREASLKNLNCNLKYGGCFVPRHVLWDPNRQLSAHTWGIAIDINVAGNAYGTKGNQDPALIALFAKRSFVWGGTWRGKSGPDDYSRCDPMHFEAGCKL